MAQHEIDVEADQRDIGCHQAADQRVPEQGEAGYRQNLRQVDQHQNDIGQDGVEGEEMPQEAREIPAILGSKLH